jgi:NADPH2:quinone reductase
MVRAIGINRPGGPEVLEVIDRPVREPAHGEVRIAVRAAAVNPTDIGFRQRGGGEVPPPWTPGMDAAGVIELIGPGVDRLAPGDEVMAAVSPRRPEGGAQAQLLVVAAASVVTIPEGAGLEQAATLPMNGLTAMLGLDELALSAGDTLAVSGGAGLLASYVIGLARDRGLRVIADAQPQDEELVRGFGADTVIPRSDDFARAVRNVVPEGVAAVYDTALLNRGRSGRSAMAADWSSSAAGTAASPSARSGSSRSWSPRPCTAPIGWSISGRWHQTDAWRSGWREPTPPSRPPRLTGRWRQAACAAGH